MERVREYTITDIPSNKEALLKIYEKLGDTEIDSQRDAFIAELLTIADPITMYDDGSTVMWFWVWGTTPPERNITLSYQEFLAEFYGARLKDIYD